MQKRRLVSQGLEAASRFWVWAIVNHPTAKTRRRVKAMEFASSLAGWSPENDG